MKTAKILAIPCFLSIFTVLPAVHAQQANFDPLKQVITTKASGVNSLYTADLDGDGDLDLLSASKNDSKIAYYVNDGSGGFGGQQLIADNAESARCVYAADIDGDRDMDVLAAYNRTGSDAKLVWYENTGPCTDGVACFKAEQVIAAIDKQNMPQYTFAEDVDGDGDMDVLVESAGRSITWYENNGFGQFEARQHIHGYEYLANAADFDGDGDKDLVESCCNFSIVWYEVDGLVNYGAEHVIIAYNKNGKENLHYADMDGDGDIDVLVSYDKRIGAKGGTNSNFIFLYENRGSGKFGAPEVITDDSDETTSIQTADLDGDGDLDILCASRYRDRIVWHENESAFCIDFESYDLLPWQQVKNPWRITQTESFTGSFSASSGDVGGNGNQGSSLALVYDCGEGDIGFAVKVLNESTELTFQIDGREMGFWTGKHDWIEVLYPISAGPHTFAWTAMKRKYAPDSAAATAWVDHIVLPGEAPKDDNDGLRGR